MDFLYFIERLSRILGIFLGVVILLKQKSLNGGVDVGSLSTTFFSNRGGDIQGGFTT